MSEIRNGMWSLYDRVTYTTTNETLDSIVAGLDLNSNDNVLAIAGSGDQAFAILEYVGKVKAIDRDKYQIKFIRARIRALKSGNIDEFFMGVVHSIFSVSENKKYFKQEGRSEKIKLKLSDLTVATPQSFLTALNETETFSKIYLSNVVGFLSNQEGGVKNALFNSLNTEGLIYVTSYVDFCRTCGELPYVQGNQMIILDERLTKKAQKFERTGWNPAVLKKVEVQG